MATNPNDIAKLLNEMVNTLQELSKKELESVESIIQEQKKNIELEKKIKESKQELSRIKKEANKVDQKIKNEEKKVLKKKNSLLSSLVESKKVLSKTSLKVSVEKTPSIKDLFGKVSIKVVQKETPKLSNMISKPQSLLDFTRKEDQDEIQVEQLHVLKEIDKKISDMSLVGSGGLFDFLTNGLKEFVSDTVSNMLGVGAGSLGGGLLGGLGGKLGGKLGKIGKALKSVPKGKAGLVTGTALAGYSAYKFMGSDSTDNPEETVEPRQFGGSTKVGKTYLVGEDGPELFSPKSNGEIIPNHKLPKVNKNTGVNDLFVGVIEDFRKGFKKNIVFMFDKFKSTFKKFGSNIWDKISEIYDNVKSWVLGRVDGIKNSIKSLFDTKKDNTKNTVKVPDKKKSTFGVSLDDIKNMVPSIVQENKSVAPVVKQDRVSSDNGSDVLRNLNNMKQPDINIPQQPVTIHTTYTPYKVSEEKPVEELDKEFWSKDFLNAFSNALGNRPIESKSRKVTPSSVW